MKVETKELIDATLDFAVALARDESVRVERGRVRFALSQFTNDYDLYSPSTDWAQGGPIIDREIGNLWKHNKLDPNEPDVWTAAAYRKAPDGTMLYYEDGPTPLIAAMRCLVASKLGDEVDVPEELT